MILYHEHYASLMLGYRLFRWPGMTSTWAQAYICQSVSVSWDAHYGIIIHNILPDV